MNAEPKRHGRDVRRMLGFRRRSMLALNQLLNKDKERARLFVEGMHADEYDALAQACDDLATIIRRVKR